MKHRFVLSLILAASFLVAPGILQANDLDGGACSEALSEATNIVEINQAELRTAIEEDLEDVSITLLSTSKVWKTTQPVQDYTYVVYYWKDKDGGCQEERIEQKSR